MYRFQLQVKRTMDVILCIAVTAVVWPVLVLLALLVKLSSPGSVFFIQERVGLNQKAFRMIKFRTMTGQTLDRSARVWSAAEESRITPIGRFLRDFGLDELPQLFNIIKGDMSIVGPRPPLPEQVQNYTEHQCIAFRMRPGVLSLAGVMGRRSIPLEQRVEYHVQYVETWSLWLDLKIMVRAIRVVFGKKNIVEVASPSVPSTKE